jgi:uncharacterized cofD-like protein
MSTKVVVIGGGTGNFSILSGLKLYKPLDLTAIVSMTDDGGSTGLLRNEFGILPPGDVRQCMVALSEESELIQRLFQHRFSGSLVNHSFGNLFHLALSEITGDEEKAILEMSRILKISGRVVPVTLEHVGLRATLEDGTVVHGESNIDLPKHNPNLKISRLSIDPEPIPNPKAIQAIKEAECIIISPGDLYTSTLPNFLIPGIRKALRESPAFIIYVCNLMTKKGETTGYTAADHVRAIHIHMDGRRINFVVVNSMEPRAEVAEAYAKEESYPVTYTVESILAEGVGQVVEADVMQPMTLIRHNTMRVAWELVKLIQENKPPRLSELPL